LYNQSCRVSFLSHPHKIPASPFSEKPSRRGGVFRSLSKVPRGCDRGKKSPKSSLLERNWLFEGEPHMRIARSIFAGSMAALALLTAPALAKNSNAQKADDKPASSSCHAYQQAADGSWTELPCQELGSSGQTQHKPPQRGANEDAH
jgi:hypothetical protein